MAYAFGAHLCRMHRIDRRPALRHCAADILSLTQPRPSDQPPRGVFLVQAGPESENSPATEKSPALRRSRIRPSITGTHAGTSRAPLAHRRTERSFEPVNSAKLRCDIGSEASAVRNSTFVTKRNDQIVHSGNCSDNRNREQHQGEGEDHVIVSFGCQDVKLKMPKSRTPVSMAKTMIAIAIHISPQRWLSRLLETR